MSLELNKKLFDKIEKLGECSFKSFDIILQEDNDICKVYRIYHSKGHCIELKKLNCLDECGNSLSEYPLIDGFDYVFMSDIFEGFISISVDKFIELIKNSFK